MSTISIIVAVDENNAIGKDKGMLCHLPDDLKYFKRTTAQYPIIMGRKTFESLPKGALPNRRNIVISRNKDLQLAGCEMATSLQDAIDLCKAESEIFIIGGGTIYDQALNLTDKLYITQIHHQFEMADTYFPLINKNEWKVTSTERHETDEKHQFAFTFIQYQKIKA